MPGGFSFGSFSFSESNTPSSSLTSTQFLFGSSTNSTGFSFGSSAASTGPPCGSSASSTGFSFGSSINSTGSLLGSRLPHGFSGSSIGFSPLSSSNPTFTSISSFGYNTAPSSFLSNPSSAPAPSFSFGSSPSYSSSPAPSFFFSPPVAAAAAPTFRETSLSTSTSSAAASVTTALAIAGSSPGFSLWTNTTLAAPTQAQSIDVMLNVGDDICDAMNKMTIFEEEDSKNEDDEIEKAGSFYNCNICLDMARNPVVTWCGHLFCWPCIYQWLQRVQHNKPVRAQECPVCKGEMTLNQLTPIYGHPEEEKQNSSLNKIPRRPRGRPVGPVNDFQESISSAVAATQSLFPSSTSAAVPVTQSLFTSPTSTAASTAQSSLRFTPSSMPMFPTVTTGSVSSTDTMASSGATGQPFLFPPTFGRTSSVFATGTTNAAFVAASSPSQGFTFVSYTPPQDPPLTSRFRDNSPIIFGGGFNYEL